MSQIAVISVLGSIEAPLEVLLLARVRGDQERVFEDLEAVDEILDGIVHDFGWPALVIYARLATAFLPSFAL